MQGVWLTDGRFSPREDLPKPVPKAGEVLVAPILSGICGTDIALAEGYYQFNGIPGHEFVGRIDVDSALQPGSPGARSNESLYTNRVVADINIGCGACDLCNGTDPFGFHHCSFGSIVIPLKAV